MEKIDKSVKATSVPQEGERRQATILFADISGFTSMSEKMDPEEVSSIVNECLGDMGTIIEKNGGTVDKYIGDCVMALFGIPSAIEEAPQKAINASIEIRNVIKEFNQSKNLEVALGVHVGINTGIVITGAVGTGKKQDYSAIGDTVNIASRLKDASTSGQVFVGASTHNQTKDHFKYNELDPIRLKGKEDPVPVYELRSTREKVHRPKLGAERMIASEMVGRDEELNKLLLHLLKLLNGEGSIVSVIGEAGIGKSRLIAELRKKDEIKQVTFLEGRALSIGKNLSFHPLIDILKNWSGIKEDDNESQALLKLEKAIKLIDPDETAEIFPFVATLMGLSLTDKYAERVKEIEGEALEKLILKNLYTLIEKGTTIKPVVLILEDLHWADLTSIEFFGSLFRLACQNRILFINVFRPGYQETDEQIMQMINDRYSEVHEEIRLKSLADNQSDLLLNNLLQVKGIPADIKALIIKQASGNPFFIEEVARSFIDEGVIDFRKGKFEVTNKIDSVSIPETIGEVLMARIDKLDEQSKSLLKTASVIGRSFFYRILTKVAEKIQEMDQKLTYLEEIQLIREQNRKDELEYLFKHALAQEATYESILLKKRKVLHIKTAQAIETIFADKLPEFYGMLAMHYSRGEDLEKAEEYLLKAGEEALRTSASTEAINYFRKALKLYQKRYGSASDPGKTMLMQKNLGIALRNKGQYIEAKQYYDNVLAYNNMSIPSGFVSRNLIFINGLFQILLGLYLPFLKWKRIPTAKDLEILELFFQHLNDLAVSDQELMNPGFGVLFRKLTTFNLTKTSNGPMMVAFASAAFTYYNISFAWSRKTLTFLEDKVDENNTREIIYYNWVSNLHHWHAGTWGELAYDKNLVEMASRAGEQCSFWYLNLMIFMDVEHGQFEAAQEKLDQMAAIVQSFDHHYGRGLHFYANSRLLLKNRRLHDALEESHRCMDHKHTDKQNWFGGYSFNARLQILMENRKEAKDSLHQAKKISSEINVVPMYETDFLVSQFLFYIYHLEKAVQTGDSSAWSNYSKKALESGRKAVSCSKKVAGDRTEVLKLMGTYYWLLNKRRKALKWWTKSIKEGEKLGARLELSRTYFEIGKRLLEDQSRNRELDGITAQEYLDKARMMFEEMDLKWDLEQLEKISV